MTDLDRRVWRLVGRRRSNLQIARELEIPTPDVQCSIEALKGELGARSRWELMLKWESSEQ
jgi:hypothetical protein